MDGKCKKLIVKCTNKEFKQSIYDIVNDFEKIELDMRTPKPRVGIVGEVLIKYHPFGNNYVADLFRKRRSRSNTTRIHGIRKIYGNT